MLKKSRGSSVGIVTTYGAGVFLFSTASRRALGPKYLPVRWVPWALSPGVKRPGRDASGEALYLHSLLRDLHDVVLSSAIQTSS
jgi:hypothetical protein